ncbi:MAG: hypothetical protein M3Y32_05545 [Pseudomonadota bacterium]|nr:hypothetical protein [Pseudomonadota bacterium]
MKRVFVLRRWLLAFCLCAGLPLASAQDAPKPITALGIFSLLGDKIQITIASEPTPGSKIETADREEMKAEGIAFDGIVLKVAKESVEKTVPGAPVSLFKVTTLTPEQQQEIALGAKGGALPAWMVQAIESKRLSHILIVTRDRGDASFKGAGPEFIGRGTVEGIGFYIDALYQQRNIDTNLVSSGMLAPFAEINVQLMDTYTAKVVQSYRVHGGYLMGAEPGTSDSGRNNDPWNFIDAQTKVRVLRDLVEKGMQKAITEVLKPR